MSPRRSERGAVAVELALGLPLLLVVVLGGIHFGLVLRTRHQLGDATGAATRSAAIDRTTDADRIRAAIEARLGEAGCEELAVDSQVAADPLGVRSLEVTARCKATTGIGGGLVPFLGPVDVSARAAMPL